MPRLVQDGNTLFLDLNMAFLAAGIKLDKAIDTWENISNFWSVGGYTRDTLKTQCQNYWTATKNAIAHVKSKPFGKNGVSWKVMRSHETPFNIEGDQADLETHLVPLLIDAGIRVSIGSHFHVGAFMVRYVKTTVKDTDAAAIAETAKITQPVGGSFKCTSKTAVQLNEAASPLAYTDPINATGKAYPVIEKTFNLKGATVADADSVYIQLVIGHSGRFLDPFYQGGTKWTKAKVFWARGRNCALSDSAMLTDDKFGFAEINFGEDNKITANFWNDATQDAQIIITNSGSRRKLRKSRKMRN